VIATAKAVEKVKNAQSVRYGGEYAAWNTRGRERETNNKITTDIEIGAEEI
jgi:hypothetical protein